MPALTGQGRRGTGKLQWAGVVQPYKGGNRGMLPCTVGAATTVMGFVDVRSRAEGDDLGGTSHSAMCSRCLVKAWMTLLHYLADRRGRNRPCFCGVRQCPSPSATAADEEPTHSGLSRGSDASGHAGPRDRGGARIDWQRTKVSMMRIAAPQHGQTNGGRIDSTDAAVSCGASLGRTALHTSATHVRVQGSSGARHWQAARSDESGGIRRAGHAAGTGA
jgi:hypothetical protein